MVSLFRQATNKSSQDQIGGHSEKECPFFCFSISVFVLKKLIIRSKFKDKEKNKRQSPIIKGEGLPRLYLNILLNVCYFKITQISRNRKNIKRVIDDPEMGIFRNYSINRPI